MISCTDCTDKHYITFHVMASEEQKKLWVEVCESNSIDHLYTKKQFDGREYWKALDYFREREAALKEQYGGELK